MEYVNLGATYSHGQSEVLTGRLLEALGDREETMEALHDVVRAGKVRLDEVVVTLHGSQARPSVPLGRVLRLGQLPCVARAGAYEGTR